MSNSSVTLNNITKIRYSKVNDADISSVCQIIKHYREICGEECSIDFIGTRSNYYYYQPIKEISYKNGVYALTITDNALLGTLGTLPRMLNVPMLNSYNEGLTGGCDFLKIFENRYYTMNLVAKNKYNLARQYEEESFYKKNTSYKISALLATFIGIDIQGDFKYLSKKTLVKYSCFLGRKFTNVETLKKLLCDYFSLNFTIEYSPMQMKNLNLSVLTKIGLKSGKNNILGENTQLGKKAPIFGQHLNVNVVVDSYKQYLYVFEKNNLLKAIDELISIFLRDRFAFSLFVEVDSSYLPLTYLRTNEHRLILGRNICVCSKKKNGTIKIPIKRL